MKVYGNKDQRASVATCERVFLRIPRKHKEPSPSCRLAGLPFSGAGECHSSLWGLHCLSGEIETMDSVIKSLCCPRVCSFFLCIILRGQCSWLSGHLQVRVLQRSPRNLAMRFNVKVGTLQVG